MAARSLYVSVEEGFFVLLDLDRSAEISVIRNNPSIAAIEEDGAIAVFAGELEGTGRVSVSSFTRKAESAAIAETGGGTATVLRVRCLAPLIVSSGFDGPAENAQVTAAGIWIVAIWRTAARDFNINVWPDDPTLELPTVEGLAADQAAEREGARRYEAATSPLRHLVRSGQLSSGDYRLTLRSTVRASAHRIIKLWAQETWMEDWNNPTHHDGAEYVVASVIDCKPTLATYLRLTSRSSTRVAFELRWAISLPKLEQSLPDEHVTTATTLSIEAKHKREDTGYTLTHEGLPEAALEAVRAFWVYRMAKCDAILRQ